MADPQFPSTTGWPGLDTALSYLARWDELSSLPQPAAEDLNERSGFLQARAGHPVALATEIGLTVAAGSLLGWPVLLRCAALMVLAQGHDQPEKSQPLAKPQPVLPPPQHQPATPGVIGLDAGVATLPPNVLAPRTQTDWPATGHRISYAEDRAVAAMDAGTPEGPVDGEGSNKAGDKRADDKKPGEKESSRGSGEPANKAGGQLIQLSDLRASRSALPAATTPARPTKPAAPVKPPQLTIVRNMPVQPVAKALPASPAGPLDLKPEPALGLLPSRAESAAMIKRCERGLTQAERREFRQALNDAYRRDKVVPTGDTKAADYRFALFCEAWLTRKMQEHLQQSEGKDNMEGRFAKKMLDEKREGWLVRNNVWPGNWLWAQTDVVKMMEGDTDRSRRKVPGGTAAEVKSAVSEVRHQLDQKNGMSVEQQFRHIESVTRLDAKELERLVRQHPEWFDGISLADPGLHEGRYAHALKLASAAALRPPGANVPQLPPSKGERELLPFIKEARPMLQQRAETFERLNLLDLAFDYRRTIKALDDCADSIAARLPRR